VSGASGKFDPIRSVREAHGALGEFLNDARACAATRALAGELSAAINAGRKVLICGNGGSSCDAMHFAEELTGRFRSDRAPLPAIACADVGHITCTANDYGFDEVFARWVRALGSPGDVLIVLSTSGNSANILRAIDAAKSKGVRTAALLGKDGGAARGRCDHEVIAPGATSDRIQEIHMLVLHTMVEAIEAGLGG
jgi:D-sedoheptulose 7-phosphate isomerase